MLSQLSKKPKSQKLFRNGGSQAVRIPKEMKFDSDEVLLRREGKRLIIEPKAATLKALSVQMGKAIDWDWSPEADKTTPKDIF